MCVEALVRFSGAVDDLHWVKVRCRLRRLEREARGALTPELAIRGRPLMIRPACCPPCDAAPSRRHCPFEGDPRHAMGRQAEETRGYSPSAREVIRTGSDGRRSGAVSGPEEPLLPLDGGHLYGPVPFGQAADGHGADQRACPRHHRDDRPPSSAIQTRLRPNRHAEAARPPPPPRTLRPPEPPFGADGPRPDVDKGIRNRAGDNGAVHTEPTVASNRSTGISLQWAPVPFARCLGRSIGRRWR